jgi:hypothetical protein
MRHHHHRTLRGRLGWAGAGVLALAVIGLWPSTASALPTASFTFAPAAPLAGDPVAFDFTGTCDEPPCRVQWRWFGEGGSSLGTAMGEGEHIDYAFDAAGTYSVVVKITNSLPTHGSATATQVVEVGPTSEPQPTVYEDASRLVVLDGWEGRDLPGASSGGYRVGRAPSGITVTRGRLRYVAVTGPDLGLARVTVDGHVERQVDLESPTPEVRSWVVPLPAGGTGPHVVRISPAASPPVSIDGFVLRRGDTVKRFDDTSARVGYGSWRGTRVAGASGGTVRTSSSGGATARISFTGSSLAWLTATGPDQGRARIDLDGTTLATVDNWAPDAASDVRRTFAGLGTGPHVVTLVVLPPSSAHPDARRVVVDAFVAQ